MLRIWIKDKREWREIENGPFPISQAQLSICRNAFADELKLAKPLCGANHSPQTAARDILKKECPKLSDFDILMLGFAVTNSKIKVEETK